MPRLLVLLSAAVVFALAWTQSASLAPKQERGILPIDPPTPYIHYFGQNPPVGRVLVVHGLDASKETMQFVCAALADSGFEIYAIDLPGHGDSPAGFQADQAQEAIRKAKRRLGDHTIVLAHSMGAALTLDLAATEEFSTLVLLAPPPISISHIKAERVLIATGELDVPRIRSFLPIAADIGEAEVESWILPWGVHSSPIFGPTHLRRIVDWLGGDRSKPRTAGRILWTLLMFAGAMTFGIALLPGRPLNTIDRSTVTILSRYVIACTAALFTLKFANPLSWLRLFATDYLIGFLVIGGAVLTVLALYDRRPAGGGSQTREDAASGRTHSRPLLVAMLAAAFVVVVPGLLAASQVLHLSLSEGRWWRFPFIALAGLPLFLADELQIRRTRPRWKSEAVALLTRALLLVFILTGILTLNRESGFLLMIVPLIMIFWIALWFTAGVVHRHTQSPAAAALFSALVQGWVFAALFVTI